MSKKSGPNFMLPTGKFFVGLFQLRLDGNLRQTEVMNGLYFFNGRAIITIDEPMNISGAAHKAASIIPGHRRMTFLHYGEEIKRLTPSRNLKSNGALEARIIQPGTKLHNEILLRFRATKMGDLSAQRIRREIAWTKKRIAQADAAQAALEENVRRGKQATAKMTPAAEGKRPFQTYDHFNDFMPLQPGDLEPFIPHDQIQLGDDETDEDIAQRRRAREILNELRNQGPIYEEE